MKRILKSILIFTIFFTTLNIYNLNQMSAKEEQIVLIKGKFCNDDALKQFKELNKYRKSNNITELVLDKKLSEYARTRAAELVVYFSHTRPNGKSSLNVASEDLPAGFYGENAAYGYNSAIEVTKAWKESTGHNTNMLKREYIAVGIGCFEYNNVKYWIQVYSNKINKEIRELPVNKTETVKIKNIMKYEIKQIDSIYINAGKVGKIKVMASVNHPWAFYELPLDGIEFKSNNNEIAKVDKKGNVYGLKEGEAIISVKTIKGEYKAKVRVYSKYKIQYLLNGGILSQYSPSEYSTPITLKNPTKSGCLFKGWYTGAGYKKKVTKLREGDVKLYARWTKVESPATTGTANLNKSTRKITFTINKKDVDGYQIYYSENKSMKNSKKTLVTNNKYETPALKKGKTYYYKVRTYILDSTGARVYSKFSSIKKIKVV